jgi:hypothetical protein
MVLLLYFSHIVALASLVITLFILEFCLTSSCPSAQPLTVRRELQRNWQRLTRIGRVFLVALAPALVLATKFVLEQAGTVSYSTYSWKVFLWWAYGIVAAANTPIHLLSSLSVGLLWLFIIGYSVAHRNIQQSGFFSNGLLLSAFALFTVYLLAPESLSGGSFLNQRLLLFALLLFVVWFGTLHFSSRIRVSIQITAVSIALLNVVLNVQVYAAINRDVVQYLSAAKSIEPNRTLLALCFAGEGCGVGREPGYLRISPLSHLSGYIAAQRHLVSLSNDQAHTNYFPVRYHYHMDPSPYTVVTEVEGRREWGRNLAGYDDATGGSIDYVLLWNIADAWRRGEDTTRLMAWLSESYTLILTSATGELRLYQKRLHQKTGSSTSEN